MIINGKSMKYMGRENLNILFEKEFCKFNVAKNAKILVAFSGGRDSVALLHFLFQINVKYNFDLYACHVNHGIRGDFAERDEKFCRDFCNKYGITLFVKRGNVPALVRRTGMSVEEAARKLRYELLFETLEEINGDYIATAHHLDDVVETFFVKVFTGSAIYNLRGFDRSDKIIRPFVNIDRGKIEKYININSLIFMEDETNFSADYVRNWIRLNIIPEIKSYNKGYLKNIFYIQEQSFELKSFLSYHLAESPINFGEKFAEIEKSYILSKSIFERRYLLTKMFEKFFRVERRHIDAALGLLNSESRRINMPDDFLFEVSFSKIMVFHKNLIERFIFVKKESDDIVFLPKICKYIKFGGGLKDSVLVIRNRRSGDRVESKKLKDILIDNKIDKFDRDRLIIVEKDGKIIWVEKVWEKNHEIELFLMEV